MGKSEINLFCSSIIIIICIAHWGDSQIVQGELYQWPRPTKQLSLTNLTKNAIQCLRNDKTCDVYGFDFSFWFTTRPLKAGMKSRILLTNGAETPYANGLYIIQTSDIDYEVNVVGKDQQANLNGVWTKKIRLVLNLCTSIALSWEERQGLQLLVDNKDLGSISQATPFLFQQVNNYFDDIPYLTSLVFHDDLLDGSTSCMDQTIEYRYNLVTRNRNTFISDYQKKSSSSVNNLLGFMASMMDSAESVALQMLNAIDNQNACSDESLRRSYQVYAILTNFDASSSIKCYVVPSAALFSTLNLTKTVQQKWSVYKSTSWISEDAVYLELRVTSNVLLNNTLGTLFENDGLIILPEMWMKDQNTTFSKVSNSDYMFSINYGNGDTDQFDGPKITYGWPKSGNYTVTIMSQPKSKVNNYKCACNTTFVIFVRSLASEPTPMNNPQLDVWNNGSLIIAKSYVIGDGQKYCKLYMPAGGRSNNSSPVTAAGNDYLLQNNAVWNSSQIGYYNVQVDCNNDFKITTNATKAVTIGSEIPTFVTLQYGKDIVIPLVGAAQMAKTLEAFINGVKQPILIRTVNDSMDEVTLFSDNISKELCSFIFELKVGILTFKRMVIYIEYNITRLDVTSEKAVVLSNASFCVNFYVEGMCGYNAQIDNGDSTDSNRFELLVLNNAKQWSFQRCFVYRKIGVYNVELQVCNQFFCNSKASYVGSLIPVVDAEVTHVDPISNSQTVTFNLMLNKKSRQPILSTKYIIATENRKISGELYGQSGDLQYGPFPIYVKFNSWGFQPVDIYMYNELGSLNISTNVTIGVPIKNNDVFITGQLLRVQLTQNLQFKLMIGKASPIDIYVSIGSRLTLIRKFDQYVLNVGHRTELRAPLSRRRRESDNNTLNNLEGTPDLILDLANKNNNNGDVKGYITLSTTYLYLELLAETLSEGDAGSTVTFNLVTPFGNVTQTLCQAAFILPAISCNCAVFPEDTQVNGVPADVVSIQKASALRINVEFQSIPNCLDGGQNDMMFEISSIELTHNDKFGNATSTNNSVPKNYSPACQHLQRVNSKNQLTLPENTFEYGIYNVRLEGHIIGCATNTFIRTLRLTVRRSDIIAKFTGSRTITIVSNANVQRFLLNYTGSGDPDSPLGSTDPNLLFEVHCRTVIQYNKWKAATNSTNSITNGNGNEMDSLKRAISVPCLTNTNVKLYDYGECFTSADVPSIQCVNDDTLQLSIDNRLMELVPMVFRFIVSDKDQRSAELLVTKNTTIIQEVKKLSVIFEGLDLQDFSAVSNAVATILAVNVSSIKQEEKAAMSAVIATCTNAIGSSVSNAKSADDIAKSGDQLRSISMTGKDFITKDVQAGACLALDKSANVFNDKFATNITVEQKQNIATSLVQAGFNVAPSNESLSQVRERERLLECAKTGADNCVPIDKNSGVVNGELQIVNSTYSSSASTDEEETYVTIPINEVFANEVNFQEKCDPDLLYCTYIKANCTDQSGYCMTCVEAMLKYHPFERQAIICKCKEDNALADLEDRKLQLTNFKSLTRSEESSSTAVTKAADDSSGPKQFSVATDSALLNMEPFPTTDRQQVVRIPMGTFGYSEMSLDKINAPDVTKQPLCIKSSAKSTNPGGSFSSTQPNSPLMGNSIFDCASGNKFEIKNLKSCIKMVIYRPEVPFFDRILTTSLMKNNDSSDHAELIPYQIPLKPNTTGTVVSIVLYPTNPNEKFRLYFVCGQNPPNRTYYNYSQVIPRDSPLSQPDENCTMREFMHTVRIPQYITDNLPENYTCRYAVDIYAGIVQIGSNGVPKNYTYSIGVYLSKAVYMNQEEGEFTSDGVSLLNSTCLARDVICTSHLSDFASDFVVPPNTIDFTNVWSKFKNLSENSAVFATIISVLLLYIIGLIYGRYQDKRDVQRWGATQLSDNLPSDTYHYQISVVTGYAFDSGTKSKVSLIMCGDHADTGVRVLADGIKEGFEAGTIRNFVLSTEACLGTLSFLRIWHDNSGKGKYQSWYLDQVVVNDLQTGEKFFFLCNQWLSVVEGDGMVERLIPVAGFTDLVEFKQLFGSLVQRKLRNDHLWFSVFSRPTRSSFTRVQRLSCCVSLLFLTMITNAMFFKTEDNMKERQALQVGPLSFTMDQVFVSLISTLIVLPPSILIATFFKKCKSEIPNKVMQKNQNLSQKSNKYKWRQIDSKSELFQMSVIDSKGMQSNNAESKSNTKLWAGLRNVLNFHQKNNDSVEVDDPNKKKPFLFPHWCIYVAWIVVFFSVTGSAFFVILYSMEWGATKSQDWLLTFCLSFFQNVIFVQPIKVLVLAAVISMIIRKPEIDDEEEIMNENLLRSDEELLKKSDVDVQGIILQRKTAVASFNTISNEKLAAIRENRLKEVQMEALIKELIGYFIFILIVFFLSYQTRSQESYQFGQTLQHTFTNNFQDNVKDFKGFYDYLNTSFLQSMYSPDTWYNGNVATWRDRLAINDGSRQTIRVGVPRLRQFRVKDGTCRIEKNFQSIIKNCRSSYGWLSDDTDPYYPKWQKPTKTEDSEALEKANEKNFTNPFIYKSAIQLNGIPYIGQLSTYKGGGYVMNLGLWNDQSQRAVNFLYDNNWIEVHTRAVMIEFTVYNAPSNMFATVVMLAEYPETGSAFTSSEVKVFRLFNYVGSFGVIELVVEIVFCLFVLYFAVREGSQIKKLGAQYFKDFWNQMEFFTLIITGVAVVMYIFKKIFAQLALSAFKQSIKKPTTCQFEAPFINLGSLATYDQLFVYMVGFVVFIVTVKFIKIFKYNRRIGILNSIIALAYKDLKIFTIIFFIYFIAFGHSFYLIFCAQLGSYANFIASLEALFTMANGVFSFSDLSTANKILGPIYFVSFTCLVNISLLAMFVTIINDSCTIVKNNSSLQSQDYELAEFIWKRIKAMFGFHSLDKTTAELNQAQDKSKFMTGQSEGIEHLNDIFPLKTLLDEKKGTTEAKNEEDYKNSAFKGIKY